MAKALQGSSVTQQDHYSGGGGDGRGSISPFKLPDQTPTHYEWGLHHSEENPDKDCPIGFKECWSFGKVVFKRYYRYDWKETSLHQATQSWDRDSVITSASRLLGINQVGCTYSIRIRGVAVTISGGSGALPRIIDMAIRAKHYELLNASYPDVSDYTGRTPTEEDEQRHSQNRASDLDRLLKEVRAYGPCDQ